MKICDDLNNDIISNHRFKLFGFRLFEIVMCQSVTAVLDYTDSNIIYSNIVKVSRLL